MSLKLMQLINKTRQLHDRFPEVEFNFSRCQPFVFHFEKDEWKEPKDIEQYRDDILATPFPVFSIEMEGDYVLTQDPEGRGANVDCAVCQELYPGKYNFLVMFVSHSTGKRGVMPVTAPTLASHEVEKKAYNAMIAVTNVYLEQIHKKKNGIFSPAKNTKGKYWYKGQRNTYSPGKVVYISSKERDASVGGTRSVDWSHQWVVRGHWRRLQNADTFGVSRTGERNVQGFTWVNSYVKGEGELINKTRKVV